METFKDYLKIIVLGVVVGLTSLVGSLYFLNNTVSRTDIQNYANGVANQLLKIKEKVFKCTIDPKTLECVVVVDVPPKK